MTGCTPRGPLPCPYRSSENGLADQFRSTLHNAPLNGAITGTLREALFRTGNLSTGLEPAPPEQVSRRLAARSCGQALCEDRLRSAVLAPHGPKGGLSVGLGKANSSPDTSVVAVKTSRRESSEPGPTDVTVSSCTPRERTRFEARDRRLAPGAPNDYVHELRWSHTSRAD